VKDRLSILIVMIAVSTVSALLLTAVNEASRDVIKRNQERKLKLAVLNALDIPYDYNDPESSFKKMILTKDLRGENLYVSVSKERDVKSAEGVALVLKGSGFWGPISLVVGIAPDDYSIKGVEILEQLETPGLGARIEESGFRDQFKGKHFDRNIVVQIKGRAPGANDVSAITGATLTSKSIEKIINDASRRLIKPVTELIND